MATIEPQNAKFSKDSLLLGVQVGSCRLKLAHDIAMMAHSWAPAGAQSFSILDAYEAPGDDINKTVEVQYYTGKTEGHTPMLGKPEAYSKDWDLQMIEGKPRVFLAAEPHGRELSACRQHCQHEQRFRVF